MTFDVSGYEPEWNSSVFPRESFVLLRLDGVNFSSWARHLSGFPFDENFSGAMVGTAEFLLKNIQAGVLAYTGSDEITLLVKAKNPKGDLPWGGKYFKIVSVASALASVEFTRLALEVGIGREKKPLIFDCRAFVVPSMEEAVKCIESRIRSVRTNSINSLTSKYVSHKESMGLSSEERIAKLWEEYSVSWKHQPDHFKFGTCLINGTNSSDPEEARVIQKRTLEVPDLSGIQGFLPDWLQWSES